MKTYYIYHIEGVKVGCTSDLQKRMADQGFTSWNILEEHTDIYEASNREIELQKEYGLPVDDAPYWQSVQNRRKWSKEDALKGGATRGLELKDGVQAKQVWANHTKEKRKERCNNISNGVKHSEKAKVHRKTLTIAKLIFTWEIAQEIRDLYSKGGWSHRTLATQYNCSAYAICRVLNNHTYTSPTWTP